MRVSNETASLIERDAGLAGGGEGTPRWAIAGFVAVGFAAAAFFTRRARRRPTH